MASVACLKKEVPQLIIYSIGYLFLVYTITSGVIIRYQVNGNFTFRVESFFQRRESEWEENKWEKLT